MASASCSAGRSRARASSSTPTCSPAARRAAGRSSGCRGCATSTPAASALPGRARPLRLPAAVAARQRHALAQARPARAGRVDRRGRPAARARHARRRAATDALPRRARGHRRVPTTPTRRSSRPIDLGAAFAEWEVLRRPGARAARRARSRCARPSAPRRSTCCSRRAARRRSPALVAQAARESRASTSSPGATARRGVDRLRARRAALRSRRRRARPSAGRALARRAATSRSCGRGEGGGIDMPTYPDGAAPRVGALTCPTSGDVLMSAAPDYEFPDWGGAAHMGGGSHGSLHRVDSRGRCCSWRHRGAAERAARRRVVRSSTSPRWRSATSSGASVRPR